MNLKSKIKYYVYVSPSKVDMLYHQIPPNIINKIEKELQINLTLVNMKFTEKQFDDNLYNKLSTVNEYLDKFVGIGEINSPAEYFKGEMRMAWAEISPNVVFFGGRVNDTAVGLGGSWHNVLGITSDGVLQSSSHTPWLVSLLEKELKGFIYVPKRVSDYNLSEEESDSRVIDSTYMLVDKISNWAFNKFEFVAKTLRTTTYQGHQVVLGTPIYVANTK